MSFTAKFVVLRCAFWELRSFGVGAGLMQIAIFEHARPAWLAKKNGEGNRHGEWNFCRRKEADIALFFQVTRLRKIRKMF